MSSFGNTTSRIIDPVFDRAGFRAEFRLPTDSVFMSNIRLLNVGVITNGNDSYNPLVGALGAIRAIAIYDGSTMLDQLQIAQPVLALKAALRRNDDNLSTGRYLSHVGTGYVAQGEYSMTDSQIDQNDVKVQLQSPQANNANKEAWISLRDLLDFCRSSMIIPTSTFKQLRIVVDYQPTAFINMNVLQRNDGTAVSSTSNALLVVDEVNDGELKDRMMKSYSGVVFSPLETDVVVANVPPAPADVVGADQTPITTSYLVHGFNNKHLKRLAIMQQPTDYTTWTAGSENDGFAGFASVAQWRSAYQVRVNGVNVLPGNGIAGTSSGLTPPLAQGGSRANRTLRKMNDAWGSGNIINGQNMCAMADQISVVGDGQVIKSMGDMDVLACRVEQRVDELQLTYSRFGCVDNPKLNQALNLVLVGEVEKAIVMRSDGSYNIVYS